MRSASGIGSCFPAGRLRATDWAGEKSVFPACYSRRCVLEQQIIHVFFQKNFSNSEKRLDNMKRTLKDFAFAVLVCLPLTATALDNSGASRNCLNDAHVISGAKSLKAPTATKTAVASRIYASPSMHAPV